MRIHCLGEDCELLVMRYAHPRNICLRLVDAEGAPVASASVNPDYELEDGMVAIKDYAGNKGILDALLEAGAVEATGEKIAIGFVSAHLCRLLVPERDEEDEFFDALPDH